MNLNVAGCFILNPKNEILLLHRHPEKSDGDTWGLPAGKVEEHETPMQACIREVQEETGLILKPEDINSIGTKQFEISGRSPIFHCFSYHVEIEPAVLININEHKSYNWRKAHQFLNDHRSLDIDFELIGGLPFLIEALFDPNTNDLKPKISLSQL